MKISGFTIGRNVSKLYYPIKESILSILPIVDEFIVVLGDSDADDTTRAQIESIGSNKIKIYDSVWDVKNYYNGKELAHQTDIAKSYCTGDWLFYLQADEVIHEKYLQTIRNRCEELLNSKDIDGILFKYNHFWGDYNHYQTSHGWYRKEIRIIRNIPEIHSWRDAQSFRKISKFSDSMYLEKKGTQKLRVAGIDAYVNHYGWVRPPSLMKAKMREFDSLYVGNELIKTQTSEDKKYTNFDYGPMDRLGVFKETHPQVIKERIKQIHWQNELQQSGKPNKIRVPHKHERFRYRLVSFIEKYIFAGKSIFEFKNYILVKA